jgi:hypothetical protein
MSETININASVRDVLGSITPESIVNFYRQYAEISDLLEQFDSEELIEQLGGIDQILEDHPDEVQDHVNNTNAGRADSEKEL